jgi:PhoPQ-activated pathogenicity-related protein
MLLLAFALSSQFASASADADRPLDVYMNKVEPKYSWFDTGHKVDCLLGGTAHFLNVTSLEWLDTTRAIGPNGDNVWTHQVAVVVPKNVRFTNVSMAVMTGNNNGDAFPTLKDEYLLVADELSHASGGIAVVIYQIPNQPYVFPHDPAKRRRTEDAMGAWTWFDYLNDPDHDPEWLPRLPMAKAGMQCMRAAGEYLRNQSIADPQGWLVSGN